MTEQDAKCRCTNCTAREEDGAQLKRALDMMEARHEQDRRLLERMEQIVNEMTTRAIQAENERGIMMRKLLEYQEQAEGRLQRLQDDVRGIDRLQQNMGKAVLKLTSGTSANMTLEQQREEARQRDAEQKQKRQKKRAA